MEYKGILISPPPRPVKGKVRSFYYFLKKLQYRLFLLPFAKRNDLLILEHDLTMYNLLERSKVKYKFISDYTTESFLSHEEIEEKTRSVIEQLLNSTTASLYELEGVDMRMIAYISFYYSVRDAVIIEQIIKTLPEEIKDNVYIAGKSRYPDGEESLINYSSFLEMTNLPEKFFQKSVSIYYILKKYSLLLKSFISVFIHRDKKIRASGNWLLFEPQFEGHRKHISEMILYCSGIWARRDEHNAVLRWPGSKSEIKLVHSLKQFPHSFWFIKKAIKAISPKYNEDTPDSIAFYTGDEKLYFKFLIKEIPTISSLVSTLKKAYFQNFLSIDAWGPVYRFVFAWLKANHPKTKRIAAQHGLTIYASSTYWKMDFDHFITWGDYDRTHLVAYWKYLVHKITACGSMLPIGVVDNFADSKNTERNTSILIMTQYPGCALSHYEDQSFRLGIEKLIKSLTGLKIYIKHHPNPLESKSFFNKLKKECKHNEIIISDEPISEIAKYCKIAITSSSTSIIEAFSVGCIPFLYNPGRKKSSLLIELSEPRLAAFTFDDFLEKINDLLVNKFSPSFQDLMTMRKFYIAAEGREAFKKFEDLLFRQNC